MDDTDQPGAGPVTRRRYGSDESQCGELYLPVAGRRPGTVIVIHGGFWKTRYGADLGVPLAADLAARGWAAWNLEYRRVGNGGGWPNTLADVAAGIDLLAEIAGSGGAADSGSSGAGSGGAADSSGSGQSPELDLDRVVAIGHSAGGHLATWAAARPGLPDGAVGANPRVRLTGVISQAGVLDLIQGAADDLGDGAVSRLLGGRPDEVPDRYRLASPRERLPLGVPVRCLHARDDDTVPFSQGVDYVRAARAAGDDASVVEVTGGHFGVIDPAAPAWRAALDLLPGLLGG